MINSDTHSVDTIDFMLNDEQQKLDTLGYKYLTTIAEIKGTQTALN